MKILHLIPSFGSGGAERQLSIIAPELADSGIECHVGYCLDGPNLQPMIGSGVHLHKFRIAGNHDPRLFWQIFLLIRSIQPDVIQTWLTQMDVVGGSAALLTRVPFILSERSSEAAYPPGWKVLVRLKLGVFAAAIVANSQGGVDYWKSNQIRSPIHLIRNCVFTIEQVSGIGEEIPAATPIILFAGRLSPEKNVVLLLDALIRLMDISTGCIAIMFGEGPMRDELRKKIMAANMEKRILLRGYTHDLTAWMNRADLCVSASTFEGNPNVVLEAAAQGCPLVLSDIPAHREIFDESSVRFVEHDSPEKVTSGILEVLQDKRSRIVKAAKAKSLVDIYTITRILQDYISVYSSAAKFTRNRLSES